MANSQPPPSTPVLRTAKAVARLSVLLAIHRVAVVRAGRCSSNQLAKTSISFSSPDQPCFLPSRVISLVGEPTSSHRFTKVRVTNLRMRPGDRERLLAYLNPILGRSKTLYSPGVKSERIRRMPVRCSKFIAGGRGAIGGRTRRLYWQWRPVLHSLPMMVKKCSATIRFFVTRASVKKHPSIT